jgi:hypothetical protein
VANDENTAINDLIARMARPITPAVQKSAVQRSVATAIGNATLPASPRALALGSAAAALGEGSIDPARAVVMPIAARDGDASDGDASDGDANHGEHLIGTMRLPRRTPRRSVVARLLLPAALVTLAGTLFGAYIAIGSQGKPADTVSPVTQRPAVAPLTASAAASVAASDVATSGVAAPSPAAPIAPTPPALIDVRIDSIPSGATVMLVDRGKTQLVGNTPVAAAIDPSRNYDLVFTYAGRPTKIEHLEPRVTQRIAVTLDPATPAAIARAAPAASASSPPTPRAAPVATPRRPVAEAPPSRKVARAASARGEGTLMISSKPPCEIVIDGKPTGLTTPQRAITLSAGRHKITLINTEKAIQRTLSIQIQANATEKVIEDLMQ